MSRLTDGQDKVNHVCNPSLYIVQGNIKLCQVCRTPMGFLVEKGLDAGEDLKKVLPQ